MIEIGPNLTGAIIVIGCVVILAFLMYHLRDK